MPQIRVILLMLLLLVCAVAQATHNRAGEITYRHLGGFQYEATIITYTKADSPADRPQLGISWGDGTVDTIPRVNGGGQGEVVSNAIKKNVYIGVHTYPGAANYILSFEDPNRNGGVVNIPNSVNIPFYVSTLLVINPFLGINTSVQLLNPPIDEACPGQPFIHNAGAYDPDGDSISYRLVSCRGEDGLIIPGFIQPSASGSFSIDAITGDLVWDSPLPGGLGEYNVAFVIEEWRRGILIGSVTRDMQINVVPCNNLPPEISEVPSVCVDAGTELNFTVTASNPDNNPPQTITLSATGGPLFFSPPDNASFGTVTSSIGFVSQVFNWPTNCSHVRNQPYFFSFKAIDNGNPNLAAYKTMQVKVVAPGPENLVATAVSQGVSLQWSESPCTQATAYAIYRRNGSFPFTPNQCQTGVPAFTGYTLLATVQGLNQTTYLDENIGLLPGNSYCYRVIALFSDGAESYTSNESCVQLPEILPVITQVSIRNTDQEQGSVWVTWSRPDDLDTLNSSAIFSYTIERSTDLGQSYSIVGTVQGLNDTTFVDSTGSLNTKDAALYYRIGLQVNQGGAITNLGRSAAASSVFLSASPSDNEIQLKWAFEVPWTNNSYVIYRKNPGSTQFDSLGVSVVTTFLDTGLANGIEYCYKVKSVGSYSSAGFLSPIENYSQELCSIAIDNVPPCEPSVHVNTSCDSLYSLLYWQFGPFGCIEDVIQLRIYFKPTGSETPVLVAEPGPYDQQPIVFRPGESLAGTYSFVSIDSVLNQSKVVFATADNCPEYELPDSFSPNGDGINELFGPFPYAFIESVDMRIFNRWGQLLFETRNPDIQWNGKIKGDGKVVPDGVYYYICKVNELRLQGIVTRTLKGSIQLFGTP